MPRRIGSVTRSWIYRFLCLRDGEHCNLCLAKPTNPISATQNEPISATLNSAATAISATLNGHSRRRRITLEVDHINGNIRDWREENLRLLCKSCNVAESNRRRSPSDFSLSHKRRLRKQGNPATQVIRNAVDFTLGPPQMQANNYYEPRFRNWLLARFDETDCLDKRDVINSGAEIAGCSTATAVTYLDKLTSSAGPLLEESGIGCTFIRLKPELITDDHPRSDKS